MTPLRRDSVMLNAALHEALTDSIFPSLALANSNILPSPPPPARLAPSSRPPLLRYTPPSHSPVILTPSPSLSFPTSLSSTRSSIDSLRSIHTSSRLQSDSGTGKQFDLLHPHLGKKFRAPNAPLVFCHGLLGFDSLTIGPAIAPLQVSHWRGIKEALEANGCKVLITRVPATSSPVDRAKVLEKKISETYPGRDVHLVGHSMGGIDCRYLITHLTQRTFRVLTLTTIATPHRGSSFASHFLSLASTRLPSVLALLELLPNGGGDGKAFESLTREAMKNFNDSTPDLRGVRYFSWGAEYEPGLIDTWKYPHSIIAAQEGPNDGLVSVQSAQWGTYLGTLHDVNHLDLVGWTGGLAGNLTTLAGFKDMHTFIHGKDVGFSAERFYGGVADLLAGVEEEEGYVVDGEWKGEEERKKKAMGGKEQVPSDKASGADKERWRMEELLQSTPSPPSPQSSPSGPCPQDGPGECLEIPTQRIVPSDGPQSSDVPLESAQDGRMADEDASLSAASSPAQSQASSRERSPSLPRS